MHRRANLALATLVLLAAFALLTAAGFPPHAGANGPAKPNSTQPQVVTVAIRNFTFVPETVTVHQGDTVMWTNEDAVSHTATEDTEKPAFDSGKIDTGGTWSYVVQKKGTYEYICTFHPNMTGKLVVQ